MTTPATTLVSRAGAATVPELVSRPANERLTEFSTDFDSAFVAGEEESWSTRLGLNVTSRFKRIIPIPVDVVRMLATTYRYGRAPFAAANFVGRFLRYAVIAAVTYALADGGKWAVAALLALAVVLALGKLAPAAARALRPGRANHDGGDVSTT